jgi:hypothetical protein
MRHELPRALLVPLGAEPVLCPLGAVRSRAALRCRFCLPTRRPGSGLVDGRCGTSLNWGRCPARREPTPCGPGRDRQSGAAVVCGGGRASGTSVAPPAPAISGGAGEPGRDQRRHRWSVGAPGPPRMPGSHFGPARRRARYAPHRSHALAALDARLSVPDTRARQFAAENDSGCY